MLETVKNAAMHKVPKSLEDCVNQDPVSQALWQWAERVAKWGIALMVWFVISAVIEGFVMAEDSYGNEVIVFVASVEKGVISACITYVSYNVLSLLIASLASIVQHTRASALLKEFELCGGEVVTTEPKVEEPVSDSDCKHTKTNKTTEEEPFVW